MRDRQAAIVKTTPSFNVVDGRSASCRFWGLQQTAVSTHYGELSGGSLTWSQTGSIVGTTGAQAHAGYALDRDGRRATTSYDRDLSTSALDLRSAMLGVRRSPISDTDGQSNWGAYEPKCCGERQLRHQVMALTTTAANSAISLSWTPTGQFVQRHDAYVADDQLDHADLWQRARNRLFPRQRRYAVRGLRRVLERTSEPPGRKTTGLTAPSTQRPSHCGN
jgi:hypothetical protein